MSKAKVGVVGAGAIGGLIAARLAQAGHSVSVIARGAHLRAIQAQGLRLRAQAAEKKAPDQIVRVAAADNPAEFGPQDVLYIATKGHSIAELLPRLRPMIDRHTVVVPAINGLPWWYFHREGSRHEGRVIRSVDPHGAMFEQLACDQIVGCVVYLAAEVVEPGLITHNDSNTLIFGEPSGAPSARVAALAQAWTEAGMQAKVSNQIRKDIWAKLTGNLSFNPVAALTGGHMQEILRRDGLMRIVKAMLDESIAVASAYAGDIGVSAERRIEMARLIGPIRPSTLQDYDAGRRPELEGLMASVIELAALAGIAVPITENIHALALAKAQIQGLLD